MHRISAITNRLYRLLPLILIAACSGPGTAITTIPAVALAAHETIEKPDRLKAYAESGDVYAMHNLGDLYRQSDPAQSLAWYCRAARRSFVQSQMVLGAYYEAVDPLRSVMWYSLAARQGKMDAIDARNRLEESLTEKERASITPMMNRWKAIPCGITEDERETETTPSPARTRPHGQ